jgi:hypothetical protein
VRRRWAVVLGSVVLAAGSVTAFVVLRSDERSTTEKAFLAELRLETNAALRAKDEDTLLEDGERFCRDLGETGSSLKAVFERQKAGESYPGLGQVATAARKHLCPELPDADDPARGGTTTTP